MTIGNDFQPLTIAIKTLQSFWTYIWLPKMIISTANIFDKL